MPRVRADRWSRLAPLALFAFCLFAAARAEAIGTPAGTPIANTAVVSYDIGAASFTQNASVQFVVDELIDVVATWQDATPIPVAPSDVDRLLTFLITNTGNGNESFSLALDPALVGDQFDPANARIYLDSNANSSFESGLDPLYQPGVNDPVLAADAARAVFVLCDIPATPTNGDRGDAELSAASLTGTGAGTVVLGGGDGGSDAVIGASGGGGAAVGSYLIVDLYTQVVKSAVVSDLGGGSTPAPGSTITYSLVVSVVGTGSVDNLVITDALPPFTTYVPGSLTLGGGSLSDAADADAGDVGGTTPNQVTVALGSVAGGSLPQTITFAVTID